MVQNGSTAARPSSCPSACCPVCIAVSFRKGRPGCTKPGSCTFLASMPSLTIVRPSTLSCNRCATDRIVHAREPFAGPGAVRACLSRHTHRVAISNSRLIGIDEHGVTFRVRDCRRKGACRHTAMTPATPELVCRFPIHVLPGGRHRIDHCGFPGNGNRADNIARIGQLPGAKTARQEQTRSDCPGDADEPPRVPALACPCCAGRSIIAGTGTALQSTARTAKGRSMTRAPQMTDNTLSRRRCHLRTHRHAPIRSSTRQELMRRQDIAHIVQMPAGPTPRLA